MTRRSPKIDRWMWSEKDLAEMSWHDVIIHAIAANTELISRPDREPQMEPRELLFDIDYVLNWREALTERRADFWISPATLVFGNVSDVRTKFASDTWPLIVIYEVRRGEGRFVVIADFFEDGSWHFADAEGDEPRWHTFQPTCVEIETARRLLAAPDDVPSAPSLPSCA